MTQEDEIDYRELPASISRGNHVHWTRLKAKKQHQPLAMPVHVTTTGEPVYLKDIEGLVRTLPPLSAGAP